MPRQKGLNQTTKQIYAALGLRSMHQQGTNEGQKGARVPT